MKRIFLACVMAMTALNAGAQKAAWRQATDAELAACCRHAHQ
jgi:hypothetical protein